jgi:RimJ/RimL family protein N-acetyltransferase
VIIETERLLMRPFDRGDLAALTELHAEPSFWWFPLRRGMNADETVDFLDQVMTDSANAHQPSFQALVEQSSGALIGWGGLSVPNFLPEVLPAVEVGWRLGQHHRGRGYATESAAAALRWGFRGLGLDTIISIFEPENVPSGRVMDRLGFDAGFETTHPARGVPLRVRSLTASRWQDTTPGFPAR